MSIQIMTLVWKLNLPDSEKLALLALADNANDEGVCWPSMATLARKCSKSDRTVQRSIQSLEEKGHLTREERPGKGVLYHIHPRQDDTPEKLTPPSRCRSTPVTVSDKPSRTTNSPQPPLAGSDQARERDRGDEHWRIPEGRSWKETPAMLRQLHRKPSRRTRRERTVNAPTAPAPATSQGYQKAVTAKSREDERSSEIHTLLKAQLGNHVYDHWLSNAAILIEETGLIVVTASSFQSSWIEENLAIKLSKAAASVAGIGERRPCFRVESVAHG